MTEQKKEGGGSGLHVAAMLLFCFGKPWRLMMTKPGTAGWRETGGLNAVWGLLSLCLWVLLWPSDGMLLVLALALLAQVGHRMRPGQGHSRGMGVSCFAHLTGGGGWVLAGLFGVAMGLGWRLGLDRSAGTWMAASGVANLLSLAVLRARERAVRHDQTDAILEAQYRRE